MDYRIFNGTIDDIKAKGSNIFIGISIGIKPLTEQMVKTYIKWSLSNSKDKVAILIADEIARYDYKIFSHYGERKSLNRALREGNKVASFFEDVVKELNVSDRNRIEIIKWNDIKTSRLEQLTKILRNEYKTNRSFRDYIIGFLKNYAQRRGKQLTDEQYDFLSEYVISELPTLLDGIRYKGANYKLLLYPTLINSGMSEFVEKIQNENVFSNLKKRINLNGKTILVETYIEQPSTN